MKNSAALIEHMMAISHLGAVSLPINYRLSVEEVIYIVGHAKLLCVDKELHAEQISCDMLTFGDDAQADCSRLLDAADSPVEHPANLGPDDLYRLMYTSGTTDHPKGVVHTYSNYYWKCLDHITTLQLDQQTRLLITGPLYHVGAFDLPGLGVFLAGAPLHSCVYLTHGRYSTPSSTTASPACGLRPSC